MVQEDLPFIPLPEDDEDDDDEEDSRTGRELVQGAMAQDSSSAAVTRSHNNHHNLTENLQVPYQAFAKAVNSVERGKGAAGGQDS